MSDPVRDPSVLASDPGISAWVAANAGSGKTHTLTNRVTRLLLAGAKPQHILCLTFTKAAAAEMQHRLFRQLGAWSMLGDGALAEKIAGIGADVDDLARARRLFALALETPGGLKVLTIHAFCQIVLSRFPLEAGVAPGFDVLDENSARALIAQARQRVLERAGSGEAHLAAAVSFLAGQISEPTLGKLLGAALGNDRRKMDRFFAGLGSRPLETVLWPAHGAPPGKRAADIARDFCAALRREKTQIKEIATWLGGDNALGQLLALDFAASGFAYLREFFQTAKGEPRKKLAAKALADARPDLLAALIGLQERFCAAEALERAAAAAQTAEAALTIVGAVRAEYAAAKALRGVLDYDDLIVKTRDLLEKGAAAQWVLFKLDGGVDHVLVDEAQDTSPEQWAILKKLTEEFFAGEEGRRGRPRTIFAVGDEKQSIFSFQGADPAQFDINRRHFEALVAGAALPFAEQPLLTSRRSAPSILGFVDMVFADPAARAGLSSRDLAVRHLAHRATAKGGVVFETALVPDEKPDLDPWLPVDANQPSSPVVRLAENIAGRIASWIEKRMALPGHDRPIRPGDIMILLRRREPFGGEVIRQLKRRGIAVAGADRIILNEQIAVMDLMALGRFVLQREDDLNLAALLRSPLCAVGEEELFALCHGRAGTVWHALTERRGQSPALEKAHVFLTAMLAEADYAPPFEFYTHALTALGGKEALLARLGPESDEAIGEFMALALAYEKSGTPSLQGFLDWMERGGAQIKRDMEQGRDEVRVMTVHGAKGLEADIVILPDTTTLPLPPWRESHLLHSGTDVLFPVSGARMPAAVGAAKAAEREQTLAEYRRLLYVALTRARDRLVIAGFENKHGVGEGSWYRLAEAAAQKLGRTVSRDDSPARAFGGSNMLAFGGSNMLAFGEVEDSQVVAPGEIKNEVRSLPAWIARPAPRETVFPRLIRPSDALETAEPAVSSPLGRGAGRFRRGLVAHALLARLPEIPPGERRAPALAFATAHGFDAALVDEVLAVLNDPGFAAAFSPQSRAEVAFLAELPQFGPDARVNGRVDRLAVTDQEVLILDFKTNRPPPRREEDVSPLTLSQMALYRAGAERIFPGKRIVCALVWTEGPVPMRLSDAILDRQLAFIARNLEAPQTA